jgi:hypothetical protein
VPSFNQTFSVLGGSFFGVGEHYDNMTSAQHGGSTPIPFALTAQQGGGFNATMQLPRAAIEDLVVGWIRKITGG